MSSGTKADRKPILPLVTIREAPPEISSSVSTYSLDAARFEPKPTRKSRVVPDYVLVGFDTEYVVPENPVSNDDIRAGAAKYRVLSYQFHCLLASGECWSGIAIPDDGGRMSLGELLAFALGSRPSHPGARPLSRTILLV